MSDINALTGTAPSDWILAEFNKAPSLNLDYVLAEISVEVELRTHCFEALQIDARVHQVGAPTPGPLPELS